MKLRIKREDTPDSFEIKISSVLAGYFPDHLEPPTIFISPPSLTIYVDGDTYQRLLMGMTGQMRGVDESVPKPPEVRPPQKLLRGKACSG